MHWLILGMSVLIGILGYSLQDTIRTNGKLEIAFESQKEETRKAVKAQKELYADGLVNKALKEAAQAQRISDNARHEWEKTNLRDKLSSTKSAVIKRPKAYGRVSTNLWRREMRKSCLATGGDVRTCKVPIIKRPTAKPRRPVPAHPGPHVSSDNRGKKP
tara:strand:- start:744 stop:1223 length:480 start_codon:yes stop_codon:yes gene_type:complete